jgi:hypothetical protein
VRASSSAADCARAPAAAGDLADWEGKASLRDGRNRMPPVSMHGPSCRSLASALAAEEALLCNPYSQGTARHGFHFPLLSFFFHPHPSLLYPIGLGSGCFLDKWVPARPFLPRLASPSGVRWAPFPPPPSLSFRSLSHTVSVGSGRVLSLILPPGNSAPLPPNCTTNPPKEKKQSQLA